VGSGCLVAELAVGAMLGVGLAVEAMLGVEGAEVGYCFDCCKRILSIGKGCMATRCLLEKKRMIATVGSIQNDVTHMECSRLSNRRFLVLRFQFLED